MARSDRELAQKNMELSFEFSRLVMAEPALAKQIPDNAVIAFEVEEDQELSVYSLRVSKQVKEPEQPLVIVQIKSLAPSRLVQPQLRTAA